MKKTLSLLIPLLIAFSVWFYSVYCVIGADLPPAVKPDQQIIEVKAACFDLDIQIQQLQQQKQPLLNKLVELLKEQQKNNQETTYKEKKK